MRRNSVTIIKFVLVALLVITVGPLMMKMMPSSGSKDRGLSFGNEEFLPHPPREIVKVSRPAFLNCSLSIRIRTRDHLIPFQDIPWDCDSWKNSWTDTGLSICFSVGGYLNLGKVGGTEAYTRRQNHSTGVKISLRMA
jgi:hypothetical protein